MKRTHALLISLALAVAVVAGSFAALRSQHLAQQASGTRIGAAQFDRQLKALDRAEARLRVELRRRPPAIPALSTVAPRPAAGAQPVTVVYHRAAPIVHVIHRHGGEHENEHESSGDGGGGDD